MTLSAKNSAHNFKMFLWHGAFLAFAQSFMDVDTIVPSLIIKLGGGTFHVALMNMIMIGGSSLTQFFFASFVSNKPFKKPVLLAGINLRIFSLFALAASLYFMHPGAIFLFWSIFFYFTIFAVSGAFANIGYTDILGKSVLEESRKRFFTSKQLLTGTITVVSAFIAKKLFTSVHFPENYALMFLTGGVFLFISSIGFWRLKESLPSMFRITGISNFIVVLVQEFRANKKLKYFLGFVNTQGIILSFLPFVILYGKNHLGLQPLEAGRLLVFKLSGVVFISLLLFFFSKKIKYRNMLYANVVLSLSLPILIILIPHKFLLNYIFLIGGIAYSIYSISMNGVLLEVSGKENRALYAGFYGVGNIFPAIFPFVASFIIEKFGFIQFFIVFILFIASAIYFIWKINCQK